MAMNQAQLQELLAAVGNNQNQRRSEFKPPPLTSTAVRDWQIFRRQFEVSTNWLVLLSRPRVCC